MMERLKHNRLALLSAVSAVLGVLAVVLYAALAADGEKSSVTVYLLLVLGILVQAAPAVLPKLFERDLAVTLAGWLGTILYAAALVVFITERVQWLYALLSKMEVAPLTALFPVTIAAFALALIVRIVSLYCSNGESVVALRDIT